MVDDGVTSNAKKAALIDFLQGKMTELGINQAQLSRRSDISPATLSAFMRGQAYPGPATLQKLARSLGYPSVVDLEAEILGATEDLQRPDDMAIAQRKVRSASPEEAILLLKDLSDRVSTLLQQQSGSQEVQSQKPPIKRKQSRKSR